MKIGFLTERMILGFGVDLVVHEAAQRLSRSHEVIVFTAFTSDLYGDTSYEVVDLLDKLDHDKNIFSKTFFEKCIQFFKTYKIDVWVIQTPPFYAWLHHFSSPVILVEHGTPDGKFFDAEFGNKLDEIVKDRHEKFFSNLRPADSLVAISEFIKSGLPENVQKSATVNHNGADHYSMATNTAIANFRKLYGLHPEKLTVLWVGRIEPVNDPQPYKGLHEFLDFSRELLEKYNNVQIVVVGRAEKNVLPYLEEIGIIPALNLSAEQMPAAFATADIYVNTSKWEGFNLALVEAQYQGTPVVAYNIGAHSEVVADGESGVLVNSLETLKSTICEMIEEQDYRLKLASGAKKHAALFTWDKNAESLEQIILQCLKRQQNSPQIRATKIKCHIAGYYISWIKKHLRIFLKCGRVVKK